jgi:hypothetical protein
MDVKTFFAETEEELAALFDRINGLKDRYHQVHEAPLKIVDDSTETASSSLDDITRIEGLPSSTIEHLTDIAYDLGAIDVAMRLLDVDPLENEVDAVLRDVGNLRQRMRAAGIEETGKIPSGA